MGIPQELNDLLADGVKADDIVWEKRNARYFDLTDLIEFLKTVRDGIGSSLSLVVVDTTTDGSIVTDGAGYYAQQGTGGATITLASDDVVEGRSITIKDEGGNAGTNAISVETEGSETIDGSANDSIGSDYESRTYVSDGTNWFRI